MGTQKASLANSLPQELAHEALCGERRPGGELVPEPILVGLAQVAGASVPTGVLDAGVDGHSAVFALRSRRGGAPG